MTMLGEEAFFYQVAQGNVEGAFAEFKFGKNPNTGSAEVPIWDGQSEYTYPAVAGTMGVASSAAADDSAGTGARTVEIFGLDANFDLANETVSLAGTAPVGTANQYIRLFRGIVRSAGSGGTAVGDIHVGEGAFSSGVPVNKYMKIIIGNNETLMALYTVPNNHEAYMISLNVFIGKTKDGEVFVKARPPGEVFQTKFTAELFQNGYPVPFIPPLIFDEKTDIQVRGDMLTGTVMSANFNMLVKNK